MDAKPSIFRKEAIEHYQRATQQEGELLRLSPAWTQWGYGLLLAALAVGLVFGVAGTLFEYASGPAVVRVEGRTDLTVPVAGVVASVRVHPGQRVSAGQTLLSFAADEEQGTVDRLQREFELQLVRYLRNPSDTAARQALTTLRAERELALTRLAFRSIRAPFEGVVGDVRIQPGQFLAAGSRVLSLVATEAPVYLMAFLPGRYRPFLVPGMPLRAELDGFHYDYHQLTIESVGDQIIGPGELKRFLGPDLSDALEVEGPLILVRARMPAGSFHHGGRMFAYFDGMPARVEARVRSEVILLTLVPGLKGLFSDER
nr:RND efflux membrane fusion protein [Myxococcus fulvus]